MLKGDDYVPLHYIFEMPLWFHSVENNGCGWPARKKNDPALHEDPAVLDFII